MLTIKDIARLADISPTAVSFILNDKAAGKVGPAKQKLVLDIVRRHGYKQNRTAKALIMRRAYRIAVCYSGSLEDTSWIGHASHHLLINSISARLHEKDYGVDLIEANPKPSLKALGNRLLTNRADGFVLLNYEARSLAALMLYLGRHGLPAISVGTALPRHKAAWVAVDREASFRRLVSHALEQGVTRPGLLGTELPGIHAAMKRRVFKSVLADHGIKPPLMAEIKVFDVQAIRRTVKGFVGEHPGIDGIIITDNGVAPIVQMSLANLPLPLFGFGDDIFVSLCNPRISFMRLPMRRLAQLSVEYLLRKIECADHPPLQRSVPCELVPGRSQNGR